jgi:hypothetical protein
MFSVPRGVRRWKVDALRCRFSARKRMAEDDRPDDDVQPWKESSAA